MCKVICVSLRGCCYFAASVHIVDSLFMVWTFIFEVVNFNKHYWNAYYDIPVDTTDLTWLGIYIFSLLILGCLIFRAIETESPKLMGGAAAIFLVIQVIAFVLTLLWWYPISPLYDTFGLMESARVGRFVIRCISTLVYMLLLGAYIRDILQRENVTFDQRQWGTFRK